MELAANENTTKAKTLLASKSRLVIFPEKNKGTKTNRFLTHCSTRSNLKYFVIYVKNQLQN